MIANDPSFQQDEMGLSRVEYAYRKIKNNITTNIYPSGFQILEPELAEKLGVSRTPVREALIRLEADRLIQLIPRRGMRVNTLDAKDVKELLNLTQTLMRSVIDQMCDEAAQADFSQIDATLARLSSLVSESELEPWVLLEEQYMLDVAAQFDNRRLKKLLHNMLEQVRRVKIIVYKSEHSRQEQVDFIERFTAALKAKQSDTAVSVLQSYLDYFSNLVSLVQDKQRLRHF